MSHIDIKTEMSAAQAVTADAISDNIIARDGAGLSPNATQNLGAPAVAYWVVSCAESPSAGDTVTFTLESATDEALTATPVVHASTGALDTDNHAAGDVLAVIPIPFGDYQDYIGTRFNVGTGLTAGKYNSAIVLDPPARKVFDDGKPVHPTGV